MDNDAENTLKSIKWTKDSFYVERIEEKFGFPVIARLTSKSADDFEISDSRFVLLHGKKFLTRIIAQTVQSGHYVIGKQVEIPTNCLTTFKVSEKFDRPGLPLRTFKSVEEIASILPPTVYIHQQLVVCPENGDNNNQNYIFQIGDEFTVLGPSYENNSHKTNHLRFMSKPSRGGRKSLHVHCKRLDMGISLPYSVRANFSTRSPHENNWGLRELDLTAGQLVQNINFPCTVVVRQNRNYSALDEFTLRAGSHFKLTGAENHRFILGLTKNNKFVEFPISAVSFSLPSSVCNPGTDELEDRKYQELLQKVCRACKSGPTTCNVDGYLHSIRFHINRSMRPTKPIPLASVLAQRQRDERQRNISTVQSGTRVARLRSQFSMSSNDGGDESGPPLPPRNRNHSRAGRQEKPLPPVPVEHNNHIADTIPVHIVTTEEEYRERQRRLESQIVIPTPNADRPLPPYPPSSSPIHFQNVSNHGFDFNAKPAVRDDSVMRDGDDQSTFDQQTSDNFVVPPTTSSYDEREDYDATTSQNVYNEEPIPTITMEAPSPHQVEEIESSLPPHQANNSSSDTGDTQSGNNMATTDNVKDIYANSSKARSSKQKSPLQQAVSSTTITTEERPVATPVEDMSVEEVYNSLRLIGMNELVMQQFYDECVDGKLLVTLNEEMLKTDFNLSTFQRHKISQFISGWRPKRNNQQLPHDK